MLAPLSRPLPPESMHRWPRPLEVMVQLLVAGMLGAVLVAAVPVPLGRAGGAGLAMVLAFPPVLVSILVLGLARALVLRHARLGALLARLMAASVQLPVIVAGGVLLFGGWAANVWLADMPFGRITRTGYAAVAGAALVSVVVVRRLIAGPAQRARLARIPGWLATAATSALVGGAAVLTDARIFPAGLQPLHLACLLVAVVAFSVTASLLAWHCHGPRLAVVVAASALVLSAPGWLAESTPVRLAIQVPPTLHTLLLQRARRLFDRDRDGFSAALGGGDCDDTDPRAYPLSDVGRDCLGWLPGREREDRARPVSPADSPSAPVPATGPPIIVMVTIDTFRCGFGQAEYGGFADICPRITRMAGEGRARLDLHADLPNTESAMIALHLGGFFPKGPPLATLLADAGYRTHAIVTHRALLRGPRIRASFQSHDETLIPVAAQPSTSTAALTTDRALAWLRQQQGAGGPEDKLFLWAHYLDPHDPYVATPGSLFTFDGQENYFVEVRRTDGEVGRLADGLASLGRARDILVLIMADHGEAFGEHGRDHHFTSVHEESARLPFVAWSPGGEPRRFVTAPLPARLAEVRPFMMAILGGPTFEPATELMLRTPFPEDNQIGIISGGWKLIHHRRLNYDELYDLRADPHERNDRAAHDPQKIAELGRRLGAHIAAEMARSRE